MCKELGILSLYCLHTYFVLLEATKWSVNNIQSHFTFIVDSATKYKGSNKNNWEGYLTIPCFFFIILT